MPGAAGRSRAGRRARTEAPPRLSPPDLARPAAGYRAPPFARRAAALMDSYEFKPPSERLEFTGERYVPGERDQIQHEHLHRYLLAARLCAGKDVVDVACGEGYGAWLLGTVARHVVG